MTYVRIKEGISRREFKRIVGVSSSTLCEYESNSREPKWSRALKLLDALGYEIVIRKKEK